MLPRLHFIPTLLLFGTMLFAPEVTAQPECFLQGSNGRNLDLTKLCGGNNRQNLSVPSLVLLPIKRRINGIPTVEVVFNGQHNLEMLFDTGASAVVLTERMALQIGVKKERAIAANTAGGISQAYLGQAQSVQAGSLKREKLVVGVSPEMQGGLGLLGQNFFVGYDVIIREHHIELQKR